MKAGYKLQTPFQHVTDTLNTMKFAELLILITEQCAWEPETTGDPYFVKYFAKSYKHSQPLGV